MYWSVSEWSRRKTNLPGFTRHSARGRMTVLPIFRSLERRVLLGVKVTVAIAVWTMPPVLHSLDSHSVLVFRL